MNKSLVHNYQHLNKLLLPHARMSTSIRTTLEVPYEENLSSIIQEPVNSEYGWGCYGDFRVLIRNKDGYINATKLCTLGGKMYKNWSRNDQSKKLVEYMRVCIGWLTSEPTDEVDNVENDLKGTYIHPYLAPHISSWISPEFALKVSKIVNNFIVRDYKEQIRVKDDKIDELSRKIDQQTEKLDKQSEEIHLLLEGTERLERNLDVANENIVCTLQTLGSVSNRSVPVDRIHPSKKERVVVLNFNEPGLSVPYCVIRGQDAYTQPRIARKRKQYPNLRVVVDLADHPNTVELWNATKKRLGKDIILFSRTQTFCLNGITEQDFLRVINECDVEKKRQYQEMLNQICEEEEHVNTDVHDEVKEELDSEEEEGKEEVVPVRMVTTASLMRLKLQELKQMCRDNGFKGWSKLNKPELVEFIVSSSSC